VNKSVLHTSTRTLLVPREKAPRLPVRLVTWSVRSDRRHWRIQLDCGHYALVGGAREVGDPVGCEECGKK